MALIPRDLSAFTAGTDEQRRTFAAELLDDYQRCGFAKIVNHGITEDEVRQLFEWNKRFFGLSADAKHAIAHPPGPNPQRGWSRIGAENSSKLYASEFAKGVRHEELQDCREHFDMGSAEDREFCNHWPGEGRLSGFREFMESCFDRLAAVTLNILKALELALGIPHGSFTARVSNAASEFRLLHYPSIDVQAIRSGLVSRIWPHFDLGVITLLFQDAQGGLEMQDRTTSRFVPVDPGSCGEMVTNISETLQRWTNGAINAGLHQVTVPEAMKTMEEGVMADRYSVAFFCKADRQASVGPMEFFLSETRPAEYKEMSAIEYQQQRLLTAY